MNEHNAENDAPRWKAHRRKMAAGYFDRREDGQITAPDLPALRALAEAAVPGPWHAAEQTHAEWHGIQSDHFALGTAFRVSDAAFIAAANPTTVLALLDEVEALRATVERVEALADECATSGCIHLNSLWGRLRAALEQR